MVEEQGAELFEGGETEEDKSALATAIENGHLEMIQYLVEEHNADMNAPLNDDDMTPLHHACGECRFDIVKYFVEDIAVNLFDSDNDYWTALHYACLGGSLEIVRYLIEEHDLDPEDTETDGWNSLHIAGIRGYLEVVKYLIEERNVEVTEGINANNQTVLHLAASEGEVDVVKYLIEEQDCNVTGLTCDDETAFMLAVHFGQLDVVKYLLEDCTATTATLNDDATRFQMMHTKKANDESPNECLVGRLESHENTDFQPEIADYLRRY